MLLLGITGSTFAQNDADLFRYSKTYHGGSARFESMGGAFGALGADISSVQINPAGMGRFSSSQASVSLGTVINSAKTSFIAGDESTKELKTKMTLPSIGVVFVKDISAKGNGNLYRQWGIGVNRIADLNQNTTIKGNQFPSLLDGFISQADGYYPSELPHYFPFSTNLAYQTWAIDFDSIHEKYLSFLNSGDMRMNRSITTKGGIHELYFAYSRNYLNKLYYGGSLNVRYYSYAEQYKHSEDLVIPDPDFNGFDYTYKMETSGTGVNLKLGLIYLVTDAFRLGASFQTPTWASMRDKWSANMTSRFKIGDFTMPSDQVPTGDYKYRMVTPLKAIISSTYVIGMSAIVSADFEYANYNMAKLKSTKDITYEPYNYETENKEAKERLTHALNVRLGAEYNINQQIFVRAGFSFYGNAYKKSENVDVKPDLSFSGGLGYKFERFSIDLAYVNRLTNRTYYPFYSSNSANVRASSNQVIVTGSFRF